MVVKKGFTLVEILIGFAILAMVLVAIAAVVNPAGMIAGAKDARRKNDLKKIRDGFEEYYNDRGGYPVEQPAAGKVSIVELMDQSNCGGSIFQPWMRNWPCDPDGLPYKISAEIVDDDNPQWFKVFTLLENTDDPQIPANWGATSHVGNGEYSGEEVNYGVSSTNVNWYDYVLDQECTGYYAGCYRKDEIGNCLNVGESGCGGGNCYLIYTCESKCNVNCCGAGCN